MITMLPLVLLLQSAAAPMAEAPSQAAVGERASLDLSGLEPLDPQMRAELARQIHDAAAAVIAGHDVPAGKLRLAIRWRDVETFDYEIAIEIDEHCEWSAAGESPPARGAGDGADGGCRSRAHERS